MGGGGGGGRAQTTKKFFYNGTKKFTYFYYEIFEKFMGLKTIFTYLFPFFVFTYEIKL